MKKDYLYIIGNDKGFIKIGVSNSPQRRCRQLQTGNEHKLTLLFTEEFECDRKHLLHIEKEVHRTLRRISNKCMGEWFEIDENKMDSIKNTLTFYRIRYENDKFAFEKPFK